MKKVLFMFKSPRFVRNVQIENYLSIDPVTTYQHILLEEVWLKFCKYYLLPDVRFLRF